MLGLIYLMGTVKISLICCRLLTSYIWLGSHTFMSVVSALGQVKTAVGKPRLDLENRFDDCT